MASDGAAPKLTDTAEKCKEALRAFVASGETEAPITVSVEAPWGAGKTSFLHHLRIALEEKDRIPTVWFNPWKHEAGKTLWAAFAVAYERQMAEKLSWLGLWRRRLSLSWQRLSTAERILLLSRLALWLLGLAVLVWLWCHGEDFAKDAESKLNTLLASKLPLVGIPLLLWGFVKDLVGSFGSPLKIDMVSVFTRNQHEDGVDDLHRFHEDFERLMCAYTPGSGPLERFMADLRSHTDPNWPDQWRAIARAVVLGICRWVRRVLYTYSTPAPEKLSVSPRPLWSQNRVVVFIDDLDRCEAPKAAEVLQSLHLMLSGGGHERRKNAPKPPGVICVLGMDREKVAAAVAAKHEKLLPFLLLPNEKDGKLAPHQALGFGHEFLEKFIQITLHLPGLAGQDQEQYLRMITGWEGEENAAAFSPETTPGSAQPAANTTATTRSDGKRMVSSNQDEAERLKAEEAKRTRTAVTVVEVKLRDGQAAFLCASYVIEALERNPRRLKQFVNLFRLRLFLATAMELLDRTSLDPQEKHRHFPGTLSVHDIAKLVALDLCCPQTMSGLREEAGVSLETIKERVKKEHPEPRQAVILKMLDSGINGDPESNSAYDLSKAPLEMYFQQLASVAQAPEAPATK
ncbi:KAP family P-loop NTPase fold protein [Prosthecobacter vanneervenii]|uniref:KAP NTPase domain-containing protein n=1 Tax=Prosthecobacter vanneervenii TaxID=48466 RepID=A0A7W8DKF2_9BACT|nr:P-loop NTPase fold protein [Prosthecobacter vanneervenii]MBB5032975.1 hypothetical protein [Prosthecobacter vanneervenii]